MSPDDGDFRIGDRPKLPVMWELSTLPNYPVSEPGGRGGLSPWMSLGRSAWFLGYVVPSSLHPHTPRSFLVDPPCQSSWGISAFPIPTLSPSGAAEPKHSPKPGWT